MKHEDRHNLVEVLARIREADDAEALRCLNNELAGAHARGVIAGWDSVVATKCSHPTWRISEYRVMNSGLVCWCGACGS
jgi:hypothetical protein